MDRAYYERRVEGLRDQERIAFLIGSVIVAWASLESLLNQAIADRIQARGVHPSSLPTSRFKNRLGDWAREYRPTDTEAAADLLKLKAGIFDLYTFRNLIAHGVQAVFGGRDKPLWVLVRDENRDFAGDFDAINKQIEETQDPRLIRKRMQLEPFFHFGFTEDDFLQALTDIRSATIELVDVYEAKLGHPRDAAPRPPPLRNRPDPKWWRSRRR